MVSLCKITWLKDWVTSLTGAHQGKLSTCQIWWPKISGIVDIMAFICYKTLQDHVIKALNDFITFASFIVSQHPTMCGDHTHCCSGEIMVVVSHVILQDHAMKRYCDFMGRSPSRKVTILQSLAAIGTLVVKLQWFKFLTWSIKTTWSERQVILCLEHLIEILPSFKLGSHGDIMFLVVERFIPYAVC